MVQEWQEEEGEEAEGEGKISDNAANIVIP